MSRSPSFPLRSGAEQIVLLTKGPALVALEIQALEEHLRLVMIRRYGPKSEKLSDHQMQLLDLEPGGIRRGQAESVRSPGADDE